MALKVALSQFELNNSLTLQNRIVMAPLTRCFADENLVPTLDIEKYYEKRSTVGLIITEGVIINETGHGYPNTPGIYTKAQIAGWKKVTDKVHAKGGKIFMQIWHVGRVSHPIYLAGATPVAPSAVKVEGRIPRSENLEYETPRALTTEEVVATINDYKQAAINAIEAGFDGVEIHGANGYLIDQFLHQHTNQRDDEYGGSAEKRANFALQVVDEVIAAIGSERTGLRLSPGAYFNMEHTEGDLETFEILLKNLSEKNLAYVHTGIFDGTQQFEYLSGNATSFLRKHYKGTLIGCGGYSAESGAEAISNGEFDLLAIGRPLIADFDYIERVENGTALTPYDQSMLGTLV